jgi:predicted Zn-dependent protease
MKTALAAMVALAVAGAAGGSSDDTIFRAMSDEMARSMKRLHIDGRELPYYIDYTVRDTDTCRVGASFGAITERNCDRSRDLQVDVRVGDYKLDSNAGSALGDLARLARGRGGSLPVDDDYDALRHKLWLRTDAAYKKAIEDFDSQKSYLKENNVEDRPDSYCKEEPVVHIEPVAHISIDMDKWANNVRKVSAIFRDYPLVRRSVVAFTGRADTRRYLNNEGFKNRIGETSFTVTMSATAQAADGMKFSDEELIPAYTEKELPSMNEIEKTARELGERLTKLTSCPLVAEDYRGPVLFEGEAGAQFFSQILAPKLAASREPMGRNPFSALAGAAGGDLKEKIGQRVLPAFITVVDDPLAKEYKGQKLYGSYVIDDDGVRGQKLTLIDKGILKTLCMSRIPTRQIKQSNGHSRNGSGLTSNLFIQSESKLSPSELKAKLIALGKDDGLKFVYIVRKVSGSPVDVDFSSFQSMLRSVLPGAGGVGLYPPILIYRVSTEDGKEELQRGAQFTNMTMRVLRDIDATGNDARAYPIVRPSDVTSMVSPSVLVKEIEIQKSERTNGKLPILKNPFFESAK